MSARELTKYEHYIRQVKWISIDAIIIIIAYIIAFSARILTSSVDANISASFILLSIVVTIISLYVNRVYKIYWRGTSGHSVSILFRATAHALAVLFIIDLLINPRPVPLSILSVAAILQFGGFVVIRYRSRLIGAAEWRWRAIWHNEFPVDDKERVLIIGAGESGQITARRLKHHFVDANYKVIGFVDDDPAKHRMLIEGCPVLGSTEDIPEIVKKHKIDLLIVAIHNIEGADLREILEHCEMTNARVKVVPDMLKMFDTKLSTTFLRNVLPEDIIGRSIVTRNENVNLENISNRVVMVTGAAGSIGSELCRQILEFHNPLKLIILDNNESALFDLDNELNRRFTDAHIIKALADVTLCESVEMVFQRYKPQIVFHAAAYKHVPMLEEYPNEAVRVNIGGTMNVANCALEYNTERFVLISTDKAVDPSSVMGASKRVCELLIRSLGDVYYHQTLFTAVRFGNVLGSRGSVVPTFNSQIDNGGPVTVTDKAMTRFFMSISEAVNLVIHAGAMTQGNDLFVLKMGEEIKIYDLAKRMIRLRGLRPDIDVQIKIVGVRPGEKLNEQLTNHFESLVSTSHPSIMKLEQKTPIQHSKECLTQISDLVAEGLSRDSNPLATLNCLCEDIVNVETQNGQVHVNGNKQN